MNIALSEITSCFEGVIPALIATSAPDGLPNISYLSHVAVVDAGHVALSNQFFAKTSANLARNPYACLLVVDSTCTNQYQIDVAYSSTELAGPLFERLAAQLAASSSVAGMADVMELKAVDVFRVLQVRRMRADGPAPRRQPARRSSLGATRRAVNQIALGTDVETVVDALLSSLRSEFGFSHALFLQHDPVRGRLSTIASLGYAEAGIGSEVALGEGVIGTAAARRQLVKISDLHRAILLGTAVARGTADENRCRTIALPGLADAVSQIAVPLVLHDRLLGVLYAESRAQVAFGAEDEAAMCIVARQAAAGLALAEALALSLEDGEAPQPVPAGAGRRIAVTYYPADDSIFLDNSYVIKGVAGRLLLYLIETSLEEGRREFTNREIRLALSQRLPELKDNLETRMLLLRKRLDERRFPVRLERIGRGIVSLRFDGELELTRGGMPD